MLSASNEIRIVSDLDHDLWRAFVDEHPLGQIFHTPEMFQVFAQANDHYPTLWAAVDNKNRPLVLFLPVNIMLMDGVLRRFTSRAVVYSSVLCTSDSLGNEALARLLSAYKKSVRHRLLFTELRNASDLQDLQPVLNRNGFIYEDHLNFIVDLARPLDEIWAAIRSNARRNIRRACKMKVVVEPITDAQQVPGVYNLLQRVYQRLEVPLADESFFQAAFDILKPQGMMEIFVAKAEGKIIGALALLLYKDTAIYWYTGTLREYTNYRAGDLLVWHIMEWANQKGFRVLDFGGAGKPDEPYGVRDFKAKFGGSLVNYGRNICVHTPLLFKLSKFSYHLIRSVLYGHKEA